MSRFSNTSEGRVGSASDVQAELESMKKWLEGQRKNAEYRAYQEVFETDRIAKQKAEEEKTRLAPLKFVKQNKLPYTWEEARRREKEAMDAAPDENSQ